MAVRSERGKGQPGVCLVLWWEGGITFFPISCLEYLPPRSAISWAASTLPYPRELCRTSCPGGEYHSASKPLALGKASISTGALRTEEGL